MNEAAWIVFGSVGGAVVGLLISLEIFMWAHRTKEPTE